MNRIEDDRVAFYLKHQERIEEWAALAEDSSEIAHDFLCSLADDLNQLVVHLGATVRLDNDSAHASWPSYLLALPEWYASSTGDLRAAIALGWHKDSSLCFTIPNRCAVTGVWANKDLDGGGELSKELKATFMEAGILRERGLSTSVWWPAYQSQIAKGEFWKDLLPYRKQILDSIRCVWTDFMPHLQKVLAL